jgi:exosome complex exonuclease RRP6
VTDNNQAAATVKPRPNMAVHAKHIPKPQLSFENVPTNNETGGFLPLLTTKPHAKIPLEECLQTFRDHHGQEHYPHPYQAEIESYEYPPSMYKQSTPTPYKPFETTSSTFVDTPEALAVMLAELKTAKEIAIDLEHHDNRSYIGIVSLMQISTRDKDWVVDTLKPWRRRLECLNEVFTDPNILKVLHGSFMDIVWLQRDLGLYIVGLFDTFHAARSLGYPGASLAFLLMKWVNFTAQKQYQLADWRIRPLSPELMEYARADTHFLLFIFDNMRNELIEKSDFNNPEKNKVQDVLEKSRETALQRYEHPVYDSDLGQGQRGWHKVMVKMPVQYTPQQFAVFRAVHKWRDDLARREDESPLFIMPNHAVFSIARSMPEDKAALFTVVQHVSHILRANADELVPIIASAKAEGMFGPDLNVTLQKITNMKEADREEMLQRKQSEATPVKVPQLPPTPVVPQVALPISYKNPPLRAPTSQFWGPLLSEDPAAQRRSMSTLNINLALPLPPLTAEIFADDNIVANEPSPMAKPQYIPKDERPAEDERTDIFVVKQLGGRKRKHAEAATETLNPMQDDQIMLEDPEATRRQEKAERKAARKAKKEQERAATIDYGDDGEAFDYANAPSVLHAQEAERKDRRGKDKKDKKRKSGFNPYAKMADAPKGLARSQKEKAGKSRTFSS